MDETHVEPELAELCRTEHARLVGMLALYVGDRAVAERLAQAALVRLHQHWPRVRSQASPHAWVSGVAVNLARSWWRRRYAERCANRRSGSRGHGGTVKTEAVEVLAVRSAIAGLPHQQRAGLVLRYYAGLSVEETTAALGCATGTLKSLTRSAVNGLRLSLEDVDDMIELEEAPDA